MTVIPGLRKTEFTVPWLAEYHPILSGCVVFISLDEISVEEKDNISVSSHFFQVSRVEAIKGLGRWIVHISHFSGVFRGREETESTL